MAHRALAEVDILARDALTTAADLFEPKKKVPSKTDNASSNLDLLL
jgi:hypothetical protein